jgi:DNA sulfur modification protein DndC
MKNSLFETERLTLKRSLELTAESLNEYGRNYRHWSIAYSGGKDSTATVAAVTHLIDTKRVAAPESLTVLYSDTRQELPPLQQGAMQMLAELRRRGVEARVVLPKMDNRYFVYMLGRGVPPPNNNTLRWCTNQLKIEPMQHALKEVRARAGEKILMLTGVRLGESAARDARIALSCGRNGGECGQGWFQHTTPEALADTLAPLLHWRTCHVWDWLGLYQSEHGFNTELVATVYGQDEDGSAAELGTRTGCIGCPLATADTALDNLLKRPEWSYLQPLKRLRPLYEELRQFKNRLQKHGERNKNGELSSNPCRKGPLTLEARSRALEVVLCVQRDVNEGAVRAGQPPVDLINVEEEARIRQLIALKTFPNKWSGEEHAGDELLPTIFPNGSVQPLIFDVAKAVEVHQ